jgi:hypothetical protein
VLLTWLLHACRVLTNNAAAALMYPIAANVGDDMGIQVCVGVGGAQAVAPEVPRQSYCSTLQSCAGQLQWTSYILCLNFCPV